MYTNRRGEHVNANTDAAAAMATAWIDHTAATPAPTQTVPATPIQNDL
jgi:hypothetical protein